MVRSGHLSIKIKLKLKKTPVRCRCCASPLFLMDLPRWSGFYVWADLIFHRGPGWVIIRRRHRRWLCLAGREGGSVTLYKAPQLSVVSLYNWLPIKVVYVPSVHCTSSYKAASHFYIWRISGSADWLRLCLRSVTGLVHVNCQSWWKPWDLWDHSKTNTARGAVYCRLDRISEYQGL